MGSQRFFIPVTCLAFSSLLVHSFKGFVSQEAFWVLQDWPTTSLHTAKALIALCVLLSFRIDVASTALAAATSLDATFLKASGRLSDYAYGVLLAK